MGFGYLTIGYLLASLIYLTANALNVGSLASLAGYLLMLYGLYRLRRFHLSFTAPLWGSALCAALTLYAILEDAAALFSFDLPILASAVSRVMDWVVLGAETATVACILLSVRLLAREVGLRNIAVSAVRNLAFVGAYAVLAILSRLPFPEAALPYLRFAALLFEFVMILLNLWLLLQCTKNICAEGDEEVTHRPSRFAWVNRISEAYDKTQDKLNAGSFADGEAFRRKNEQKNKQKRHKKKK